MEPPNLYPVKLYVYDLSKGLARRLSPIMLQLVSLVVEATLQTRSSGVPRSDCPPRQKEIPSAVLGVDGKRALERWKA